MRSRQCPLHIQMLPLVTGCSDYRPLSRSARSFNGTPWRALSCHNDLRKILTVRVYEVASETPLSLATTLSARLHNKVWLKRGDQQTLHNGIENARSNRFGTYGRRDFAQRYAEVVPTA